MTGGIGEFFDLGDLGIGIGFEEVGRVVGREAEIDAGVAIEFQGAADPLGQLLDAGAQLRRQFLGRPGRDAAALLIFRIVLDLLRGDAP